MKTSSVLVTVLSLVAHVAADAVHLVDCNANYGGGYFGEIAYYANDADSYNGQSPTSGNICNTGDGSSANKVHWVNDYGCTYTTGVKITTNIQSAGSNTGDWVGTANNGYETFQCYKDSGRTLWTFGIGVCESSYYCLS